MKSTLRWEKLNFRFQYFWRQHEVVGQTGKDFWLNWECGNKKLLSSRFSIILFWAVALVRKFNSDSSNRRGAMAHRHRVENKILNTHSQQFFAQKSILGLYACFYANRVSKNADFVIFESLKRVLNCSERSPKSHNRKLDPKWPSVRHATIFVGGVTRIAWYC